MIGIGIPEAGGNIGAVVGGVVGVLLLVAFIILGALASSVTCAQSKEKRCVVV